MYSVENAAINGYMADPFFAKAVYTNKSAFTSMSWSDDVLETNDIAKIEEIEFSMRAYDYDNWGDDLFNETFTLNP